MFKKTKLVSLLLFVLLVCQTWAMEKDKLPLKANLVSPPITIKIARKTYQLGMVKDKDQKHLAATTSNGQIIRDADTLKKIFLVQYVYRLSLTDTIESLRIKQIDYEIERIQTTLNMSYLTDAVLFLRDAASRALAEAIVAALSGGSSTGRTIAKVAALSGVKSFLKDPVSYAKGINYLAMQSSLNALQRARKNIAEDVRTGNFVYERAKQIHTDIVFGLSRSGTSQVLQGQLYLAQGGSEDLLSQLQKVGGSMADQLVGKVTESFKHKVLIDEAVLGARITDFLIRNCPAYAKYVRDTKNLEKDFQYETSQYYVQVIEPTVKYWSVTSNQEPYQLLGTSSLKYRSLPELWGDVLRPHQLTNAERYGCTRLVYNLYGSSAQRFINFLRGQGMSFPSRGDVYVRGQYSVEVCLPLSAEGETGPVPNTVLHFQKSVKKWVEEQGIDRSVGIPSRRNPLKSVVGSMHRTRGTSIEVTLRGHLTPPIILDRLVRKAEENGLAISKDILVMEMQTSLSVSTGPREITLLIRFGGLRSGRAKELLKSILSWNEILGWVPLEYTLAEGQFTAGHPLQHDIGGIAPIDQRIVDQLKQDFPRVQEFSGGALLVVRNVFPPVSQRELMSRLKDRTSFIKFHPKFRKYPELEFEIIPLEKLTEDLTSTSFLVFAKQSSPDHPIPDNFNWVGDVARSVLHLAMSCESWVMSMSEFFYETEIGLSVDFGNLARTKGRWFFPDKIDKRSDGSYSYDFTRPEYVVLAFYEGIKNREKALLRLSTTNDVMVELEKFVLPKWDETISEIQNMWLEGPHITAEPDGSYTVITSGRGYRKNPKTEYEFDKIDFVIVPVDGTLKISELF